MDTSAFEGVPMWEGTAPTARLVSQLLRQGRCARHSLHGSPRACSWLISCWVLWARPSVSSGSNTDAGLSRLVSTTERGQCPASQRNFCNVLPCATTRGESAVDQASTIGTSREVRAASPDSASYLLASAPR